MKGVSTEFVEAKTSNPPKSNSAIKIGISQNFFLAKANFINSFRKDIIFYKLNFI